MIDNHVIRYIPPEEYSVKYNQSTNRKRSNYGCVVVGALSTDPLKVRAAISCRQRKFDLGIYCKNGFPSVTSIINRRFNVLKQSYSIDVKFVL